MLLLVAVAILAEEEAVKPVELEVQEAIGRGEVEGALVVLERAKLEEELGRGDVGGEVVGLKCIELECAGAEEVAREVSVLARLELEGVNAP